MENSGLLYLKEVAKYFMDFLETDFHKRKNPRRTIKLRSDDNLLVGIRLDKYPKFNDAIWKSIRDSFGSNALKSIAKGAYRSSISANLLDLIKYQMKNVTTDQTEKLADQIANIVENYALSYKDEFDKALTTSLEEAAKAFQAVLVNPFIGSIAKSLESAGIGDENSIYLMEEELTDILVKGIENKVSEVTKQLIADESQLEAMDEMRSVLEVEEIKATLLSFFENYQVTDLFNEIFEIARNKNILETQELYLYFCDITFNSVKYPIFYIPVNLERQGDAFAVEFDSHVYINKKALEFIVQEYRNKTGKIGDLKTVKERIVFLADHNGGFKNFLGEILTEIVGFFELDTNINLADSSAQTAKSMHVRISNACYISLFDKSDEAVVNDYEEILRLLNEEDSELAKAFQKIIEDFIHNDPKAFISDVEGEWDGLDTGDKLVFEAPIPLNEEQRQILIATKRPGCNYITVEGPPGTGKSHTITAIVCDCVLNDKPVLVLSDKKEALDVVEDKISDALNKVRHDRNFQNPILRLGKTGSTYAQILAPAVINSVKTHYRAVRNDSAKLDDGIAKAVKSLKEDVETEILISQEIDFSDISRCYALEKQYAGQDLPIALEEFLANPDSFVELEEFRQIFGRLNEMFCSGDASDKCRALSLLKVPAAECHNTDTLRKLIRLSGDTMVVATKIRDRFADLHALSSCEKLTDASFTTLHEFTQAYTSLKSGLFGFLFKGGKVRALNERFKTELPLVNIDLPHKHLDQLQHISSIFNYAKANQPESTGVVYDFILVISSILKQESAAEELSAFVGIDEDLKYLTDNLKKYPNTLKLLGIDMAQLAGCSSNKLVAMGDEEFKQLVHYITLRQKLDKAFSTLPDTDYETAKSTIEKLVTVQMTYQMDKRVIDFAENNKATAMTLRKIIQKKQKFPRDEFSKLREAFPCILAGIRDYAEYIPLQPEIFDLVIIDEASQVSIAQAFPALLRAKKVLILGDKKQFSNVKAAQARSDTNREYLNNLKDTFKKYVSTEPQKLVRQDNFNIKTSILEFFEFISNYTIQLNKYFRGYKEIISYSNRHFYKGTLQVMKIRGKVIDDVLKFEFLDHDGKIEPVPKSNSLEVEFIVSELKRLKETGGKSSVGIITPHTNQQKLILEAVSKLPDRDFYFEELRLKIMTFDTCQGEERDIIYYSMVATANNDRLWGVFIKDLDAIDIEEDGKIKAQRLNVGFSRAKERMHFLVSKPLDGFTGSIGDALRHYWRELEAARQEPLPDSVDPNSPMEKDVLQWITQTGFWLKNKGLGRVSLVPQFNIGEYLRQLDPTRAYQHPKYKVDFLLVYRNEKGREHKIVIEYDGFKEHFTNHGEVNEFNYSQYYSPEDVYRQKTLESYGYKFIRINKFNSGKNPIETLDKRLAVATADKNGDVDVLKSIHDTIDNIQNNGAKECPKCKVIREADEFKDPACSTGYGRICVYCKKLKTAGSTAADNVASGGRIMCPKCKSVMVLRHGRRGKFYGCSRYPICNSIVPYR
ncbi:MAG: topoisomerase DNA-binding C4 zinc finger domain-containing protein [Deltaproteobacteria bacterium]|nr:topoisomerase DNA-binding C4 zinc finger domain-containing protein [Deltaproteobacteria bacterium]